MRKHLLQDFTRIYHLDLHGNVRLNPKLSGTTHNVFGIQVGVGVTVAVRSSKHRDNRLFYFRVPENWRKEQKLAWIAERKSLAGVQWEQLVPDSRHTWFVSPNAGDFAELIPTLAADGKAIYTAGSPGLSTNRDEWLYDFSKANVEEKARRLIKNYNYEGYRLSQEVERPDDLDAFVNNDRSFMKWTDRLKNALATGSTIKFDQTLIRSRSTG